MGVLKLAARSFDRFRWQLSHPPGPVQAAQASIRPILRVSQSVSQSASRQAGSSD